jgi:hypothetical protein
MQTGMEIASDLNNNSTQLLKKQCNQTEGVKDEYN